jgi:hypothetical protein
MPDWLRYMTLWGIEIFAIIGFLLAAYSIVANDAIQTLGTFLSSNSHRHWVVLWLYACSIIIAVMVTAWLMDNGDISYGRLNQLPYPEAGITWWHALPPLCLMALTRFGIPVSTTFLVLTIFTMTGGAATEGVLEQMLLKSALGYVLALLVGGLVYFLVANSFERWIADTPDHAHGRHWTILQWCSTAFLWSQWLVQDLANIFVFLPRKTLIGTDGSTTVSFDPTLIVFATVIMLLLHAYIFATKGGSIQKIVLSKTNTSDVRAATLVDFLYALILIFFQDLSDIPMSTTWVFLGLLAGREIAIARMAALRDNLEAFKDVASDVGRALFGLVVSVIVAIALPTIATGKLPAMLMAALP